MWLNLEVNEQGVHPIGEEERALFAFHKCGFGEIAFRFGDSLIGYELDAIIDSQVEEGVYLGRIFADAPEIDGNIFVTGDGINIGDLIPVEIVDRQDYDLIGIYHGDEAGGAEAGSDDEEVDAANASPGDAWEPGQG